MLRGTLPGPAPVLRHELLGCVRGFPPRVILSQLQDLSRVLLLYDAEKKRVAAAPVFNNVGEQLTRVDARPWDSSGVVPLAPFYSEFKQARRQNGYLPELGNELARTTLSVK